MVFISNLFFKSSNFCLYFQRKTKFIVCKN